MSEFNCTTFLLAAATHCWSVAMKSRSMFVMWLSDLTVNRTICDARGVIGNKTNGNQNQVSQSDLEVDI